MSSQQPSTQPERQAPAGLAGQPSRTITATPNLIARSDNAGVVYGDQSNLVQRPPEEPRIWSNPAPFATQLDEAPQPPRDRLRSYPTYGPPVYPVATPQAAWGHVDPRYPQPMESIQPMAGQPHGPYQYSQHPLQYPDPRYPRDVRYFTSEFQPRQAFPGRSASFDPSQHPRYRQATYPFVHAAPLSYEQPQSAFAVPQSPVVMQPTDFPQVYGRQPMVSRSTASGGPFYPIGSPQHAYDSRQAPSETTPSYPRGPPRKPKQSGFAVWVGNLSPGTTILDLKDYFSRGATNEIESVFLISKSNCAFVNYKTADSAQAAVARFHDSRFNNARLVCRLRHGQAPTTTNPSTQGVDLRAPEVEDAEAGVSPQPDPDRQEPSSTVEITGDSRPDQGVMKLQITRESVGAKQERVLERYFIVKSLTLQDLEASVRDGIWATQSHNEVALKEAFESAQDVYLIFSANKSGEYFGYARMKSNINPSAVTSNPKAKPSTPAPADGPTSTPTPATEHAPKGRVVDDSARGTIFWEADSSSDSETENEGNEGDDGAREESPEKVVAETSGRKRSTEEVTSQDWGRPFQVEWLSTSRLPFYRTRGLRNPWNSNREVKIARDGTELEPSVGRRLLDLFHQSIPNPTTTTGISYQMPEGPVVVVGSAYTGPDQHAEYHSTA